VDVELKHSETKCEKCGIETDEIWVCLCCGKCLCGRFVNKCMVDHSMKEYHLVALSLADLSFWCYVCDCYIINTNPILKPIYNSGQFLLKMPIFKSPICRQFSHQIAPNSSYKNILKPICSNSKHHHHSSETKKPRMYISIPENSIS